MFHPLFRRPADSKAAVWRRNLRESFFFPYLHIKSTLFDYISTVAVSWLNSMNLLGESHRLSSHVWAWKKKHIAFEGHLKCIPMTLSTQLTTLFTVACHDITHTHTHTHTHMLYKSSSHTCSLLYSQHEVVMATHCWSLRCCWSQWSFLWNCPPGASIYFVGIISCETYIDPCNFSRFFS